MIFALPRNTFSFSHKMFSVPLKDFPPPLPSILSSNIMDPARDLFSLVPVLCYSCLELLFTVRVCKVEPGSPATAPPLGSSALTDKPRDTAAAKVLVRLLMGESIQFSDVQLGNNNTLEASAEIFEALVRLFCWLTWVPGPCCPAVFTQLGGSPAVRLEGERELTTNLLNHTV